MAIKLGLSVEQGPYRLLENGKKSCIRCNTITSHCGCPDSVSQSNHLVEVIIKTITEEDIRNPFSEVKKPGTYKIVKTTTRHPTHVEVTATYELMASE